MGDLTDPYMRNPNGAVQARAKAQNRANLLQLKHIGQSHPTGLTANLLKLFQPRPPLEYKPPVEKRKCPPLTGMGQFVAKFAEPEDAEYAPPVQLGETKAQKKARILKLRLEKGVEKAAEELEKYDPHNDSDVTGDPYKTLFVARLNYETSESRIKREFESYGPIKRVGNLSTPQKGARDDDASRSWRRLETKVRLITDKDSNKPRGYAFVEYLHTRDMKAAYKQADGRKIDGRRVIVDVERSRTVPNWRPRRLGGGLGTTRVGSEDLNQRHSGREQSQSAPPKSEEPRAREDGHGDRDRERSRDRGRDRKREREKSEERSTDRHRDRDHTEDRHHRDRDRIKDRDRDRERDQGRDRGRERGRERDRARDHELDKGRERERRRDRERDYDVQDVDHDRGHSQDKESEYDHVSSKHEQSRSGERKRAVHEDDKGRYEHPEYGRSRSGTERDYEHYEPRRGQYDHMDVQGDDRYDQMEEDNYHHDHD